MGDLSWLWFSSWLIVSCTRSWTNSDRHLKKSVLFYQFGTRTWLSRSNRRSYPRRSNNNRK